MKKSGCVIIALFVALCVSMFVNLLLFAALVGMRGSSNVTASRILREKEFEEVLVKDGTTAGQKIAVIPLEGIIAYNQAVALARTWFKASRMHSSRLAPMPKSKRLSSRWIARAAKLPRPTCSTTA